MKEIGGGKTSAWPFISSVLTARGNKMKISLHLDFNLWPQILAKWCVRFRGWGKGLGERENVEELPSATAYDSSHHCTIHQDNHCTGLVFCTISPISVERNYSKAGTNRKRWKRERERERERERGQQRHHRTTVTLRIIKTNLMQLGTKLTINRNKILNTSIGYYRNYLY